MFASMEVQKKNIAEQFKRVIDERHIRQSGLANDLFIARSTLHNMLSGRTELGEKYRIRLNELLGTDFGNEKEND